MFWHKHLKLTQLTSVAFFFSSTEELKGPLEEHVKKFNAQHPGLLKIVRHQERMGLTEARISGWKASRADVVAILDAHIEVNTEW